jgi:hypothetical protein
MPLNWLENPQRKAHPLEVIMAEKTGNSGTIKSIQILRAIAA